MAETISLKAESAGVRLDSFLAEKDKYSFFLGGNQPLCVISSESDGERLLVIRDSYSDCLAPFLAGRFSQVHMMDLRYYRESVSEYIKENSIDKGLVLYSFSGFTDSGNLNLFLLER